MPTHESPSSFHASPQDAMHSAEEEFLYLACLHEGTGVKKPDFLAVIDAEHAPGAFGTGWPRARNEAPTSTVKRESDVTLNCDD